MAGINGFMGWEKTVQKPEKLEAVEFNGAKIQACIPGLYMGILGKIGSWQK
jgi:hypothetical protein